MSYKKLPTAFSLIAYVNEQPAGLINAIMGFSTFKCQPLINIHDLAVIKTYRGQGISQALLSKLEELAVNKGCCKITLEGFCKAISLHKVPIKIWLCRLSARSKYGKSHVMAEVHLTVAVSLACYLARTL